MKKTEFLKELEGDLSGLPKEDVEAILEDYKEHFKIGKENKRKDSEIIKSFGDPKKIARDTKDELIGERNLFGEEVKKIWFHLKDSLKMAYGGLKKVTKRNSSKVKNKSKSSRKSKINAWAIIGFVLVNLIIVIPIWVSLFSVIIGLIISGVAITFSGVVSFCAILFSLAMPFANPVINVLLSGLFASLALTCFGIIFSILSWKLGVVFFKLTNRYLRWNKKYLVGVKE